MQPRRLRHDNTVRTSQQVVTAARQQGVGIDQIVTAMSDIQQVTDHFVVSTNQTKVANESLTETAQALRASVAVYRL